MASLRLRNGIYSVIFWWDGKQRIKSLGTDNEAEAKQIKRDVEDQITRIRKGESEDPNGINSTVYRLSLDMK